MSKEALDAWMKQHPRTGAVSEDMINAVAKVESAGDDYAVSSQGAIGPMQVIAGKHGLEPSDIANPAVNREVGSRILDKLHGQFGGDMTRTLRAYNQGPGNERRREGNAPRETREYPGKVNAALEQWMKDHPPKSEWGDPRKKVGGIDEPAMKQWKADNPVMEAFGKGAKAVMDFAEKPFGYENPPVSFLLDITGARSIPKTAEMLAYGDRLTTGKGETLKVKDDVLDTALLAAPVAGRAMKAMKGKPLGLTFGPPTKAEELDYNRLISRGKTPEEAWGATQIMKTDEGLFKRIDDSKSKWTGVKAMRDVRPSVATELDDANEALVAFKEGRPAKTQGAWELMTKVKQKGGDGNDYLKIINDVEEKLFAPMLPSQALRLDEILHHPTLYYRHPELKPYKTRIGSEAELDGAWGHHDPSNKEIVLSRQVWEDIVTGERDKNKGTLLHEIQHAIDTGRKTLNADIESGANRIDIQHRRNINVVTADIRTRTSRNSVDALETAKVVKQYLADGEAKTLEQALRKVIADGQYFGSADNYRGGGLYENDVIRLAGRMDDELDALGKSRNAVLEKDILRRSSVPPPVSIQEAHRLYTSNKGEARARLVDHTMDVPNKLAPYPMGDANLPGTFDVPMEHLTSLEEAVHKNVKPPKAVQKPRMKP
jgi:hypothetical protein